MRVNNHLEGKKGTKQSKITQEKNKNKIKRQHNHKCKIFFYSFKRKENK